MNHHPTQEQRERMASLGWVFNSRCGWWQPRKQHAAAQPAAAPLRTVGPVGGG